MAEAPVPAGGDRSRGQVKPRIILHRPDPGFHHPLGRKDILEVLMAVGPLAAYGLRSIELSRAQAPHSLGPLVFGRYEAPGRIVLYEQPVPPWRFPGVLKRDDASRFERAGAVVALLPTGTTLVDWPGNSLRRFMTEDVLLHEIGHHVLQQHKGKRPVRIARTRDHEAFASGFARQHQPTAADGRSR